MPKEILISAQDGSQRIALLEDGHLAEIDYEQASSTHLVGNIYKGVARDVLNGLAAFVDVGLGEDEKLFLSTKEINGTLLKRHGLRRGDAFPIRKVIHPGAHLVLQVKRAEINHKNPQGTTRISLPGRFWVFMPQDGRMGISRRIESRQERLRLKHIAKSLKRPEEGLIARTAARNASEEDLQRDFNFLLGTWKGIEEEALRAHPPKLLYQGPGFVRSYLRDRLLEDIDRLVIEGEAIYHDVENFLDYLHLRAFKRQLELYQRAEPLFERYRVEEQIRQSLEPTVHLGGGGSLVIEETEALTAIDVNTGRNVHFNGQEAAILATNLEAAREIPRQLRLRKISGIIIVDLVDMKAREHQRQVLQLLEQELKKDRVPTDLIDMTPLGLVEITRKRQGESLADMLAEGEA